MIAEAKELLHNSCFPLIGDSEAIRRVCEALRHVAPFDTMVLLRGESGTGKNLVARLLHEHSRQKDHPLISLDCSAMPEDQLETELFGRQPSTFREGNGTIFLDEVGALPVHLQGRLLRAIEVLNRSASFAHPRLIAATSRDLNALADAGQFRGDLYFRLSVVPILLPPLRERVEDLPALLNSVIERLRQRLNGKTPVGASVSALECLRRHPWPGNVRELESVIEHACVCARGDFIEVEDLPDALKNGGGHESRAALHARLNETEREVLMGVLQRSGNALEAARQLGVSRATLFRKARHYGISVASGQSRD